MGVVLANHSMSLDGFIAGVDGRTGPLHQWLFAGERPSRHDEQFRLSDQSRTVFDCFVDRIGATIAGRKTYDDSDGWGGKLPFDCPYFIVTHRPPAVASMVPFRFVTQGLAHAIELAKSAAGERDIAVMGGAIVRQCLAAGWLDEIGIDLVPILLGKGTRLLEHAGHQPLDLERTRIVEAPGVTHLSFRVVK